MSRYNELVREAFRETKESENMPYKEMKLPKEYSYSCTPIVNNDGTVVDESYIKYAEYYCTKCDHVQSPAHGLSKADLDQLVNAWNQSGACPECGAENAWGWRQVEKLTETKVILKNLEGANDKAASAGSGAAAGGADLTHA